MRHLKNQFQKINKIHIGLFIGALLLWGFTFLTDQKIFTTDALNMNCLPIDTDAVPLMHILTKILVFLVIFGMLEFFWYAFHHKKLLIAFFAFFALYLLLLLCSYPGYYMSDDTIIFGYATRYYPVYWHNYLTSLFYMVGMSLFPASTGPIILNDLCLALVFAYIFYRTDRLFSTKIKYGIVLCGLMPFVLLSGLMCFRPALYAPFFLFFFAFLYFDKKEKKTLSWKKLVFLSFLTALLCFWRSEGIVLIIFCLLLLPLCYGRDYRKLALFVLSFVIFFTTIKIPQSQGEAKYYGSDYLIISTIRPLSLIIHREQTYAQAQEDLANIDAVISLDYISYETLSCSSYNRYNSDFHEGRFTETGASQELQSAYLKSACRLIAHNLDLYLGERLQLFLTTNGIYHYNPALVMGMEQVTTSEFHLYQSDKAYGRELIEGNQRLHITGTAQLPLFLFRYGGEAYLPVLLLLVLCILITCIRKNWFIFFALASLLARELVIFFTAPASFIQYSYPTMFVTVFFAGILLLEKFSAISCRKVEKP
jgi:hypothetical protein